MRAVHTSHTLSLAALEVLAHADPDLVPPALVSVHIDVPDALPVSIVDMKTLPQEWRQFPSPEILQEIGRRWVEEAATIALLVPSALIPHERNVVLNPVHPAFAALRAGPTERFTFDPRLLT
jgi:RES domain-containing protein